LLFHHAKRRRTTTTYAGPELSFSSLNLFFVLSGTGPGILGCTSARNISAADSSERAVTENETSCIAATAPLALIESTQESDYYLRGTFNLIRRRGDGMCAVCATKGRIQQVPFRNRSRTGISG
jgi:hypothetical protein